MSGNKWDNMTEQEKRLSYIRNKRRNECFDILDNRSVLWYESLTATQKAQLKAWYEAWLNAPATGVMPNKPEFLK